MKFELVVAIFILMFACFDLVSPSCAATFNYNSYGLSLSGEIVEGDAERAVNAIIEGKAISKNIQITPSTLVLDSVGGDIYESLKISSLIKSLYMKTAVIPDGKGYCASSCFFIFIAGMEREASGIDKIKREGFNGNLGPIGIHRPYFGHVIGGPDSIRKQDVLMNSVTSYLEQERVPHSIIELMMSHSSNDIYWLHSNELELLGKYKAGYEEEIIAKCNFNSKEEQRMNAKQWIASSENGVLKCVFNHYSETYGQLRKEVVHKLSQGWRPWSK